MSMPKPANHKLLPQYSGHLTPAEIAEGMNAAIRNANRLASDARMLLDSERIPTAISVAALAIEEAGKVSILRHLSVANSPKALKEIWRDYRSHTAKNTMWILPCLVTRGLRHLREFSIVADQDAEHPSSLNAVKQIGFYTDCYGDKHWSIPSDVIDRELASRIVQTAELLCKTKEVPPREIELWVEILGPVWGTPAMEDALLRWHEAMVEEGLTTHTQEGFEQFVKGYMKS